MERNTSRLMRGGPIPARKNSEPRLYSDIQVEDLRTTNKYYTAEPPHLCHSCPSRLCDLSRIGRWIRIGAWSRLVQLGRGEWPCFLVILFNAQCSSLAVLYSNFHLRPFILFHLHPSIHGIINFQVFYEPVIKQRACPPSRSVYPDWAKARFPIQHWTKSQPHNSQK